MTDTTVLTAADVETIRQALSYARDERETYAYSLARSPENAAYRDAALKLVEDFETLSHKIFGEGTMSQQEADKDRKKKGTSIHDLPPAETSVVWDEDANAWKIDLPNDGVLTFYKTELVGSLAHAEMQVMAPSMRAITNGHQPLLFGSYNDAAKIKAAYLAALGN